MLIDWFTVGAQVVNFVILVWLLKRFLYKPILQAIDAREKRISAELADADRQKTDARGKLDDLQSKNKAFDEERNALLAKAVDESKAERERLLGAAHEESDGLRRKEVKALRDDRARLGQEIARLAKEEVFAIARKTLADLATTTLEERMGDVFTRRLREMNGEAKGALAAALRSSEPALVRSTFDLPKEQRAAIQNALNVSFSAEVRVRFETANDALCGIELSANGQKLAWSIADYLSSLEQKVGALLDAQSTPSAEATLEPNRGNTAAPGAGAHGGAK
jgi:F-type H+-transporting ATPase subunit b